MAEQVEGAAAERGPLVVRRGGGQRRRIDFRNSQAVEILDQAQGVSKSELPIKLKAIGGCGNARTFIQSGNVIFSAPPGADEGQLHDRIGAELARRFGYIAPLALRTSRRYGAARLTLYDHT